MHTLQWEVEDRWIGKCRLCECVNNNGIHPFVKIEIIRQRRQPVYPQFAKLGFAFLRNDRFSYQTYLKMKFFLNPCFNFSLVFATEAIAGWTWYDLFFESYFESKIFHQNIRTSFYSIPPNSMCNSHSLNAEPGSCKFCANIAYWRYSADYCRDLQGRIYL